MVPDSWEEQVGMLPYGGNQITRRVVTAWKSTAWWYVGFD